MKRSKPLAASHPLKRRAPLPGGRPRPAVPGDVRATLAGRSGGWCEARLSGCWGQATDVHHRISQKAGGRRGAARERHDRLANCVHVCRGCHAWITARPAEARDLGLALAEWQTPTSEPVRLHYDDLPVFLDDAGGWHRFEEVGP